MDHTLKILGRRTSSNVQVVMWAVNELGLPHTREDRGGPFGGVDTAEYKAMNPNGLVPVLIDGDNVLWESGAILRYLGAQYGNDTFWPQDPGKRAALDMWAEWTKTTLYPVLISSVFWTLVRTPSAERNLPKLETDIQTLGNLMQMLDRRIADGPFLSGKDICFADLMVAHVLYRYYTLPIDRADTPSLDQYYARMNERSLYREHVMVDYSGMQVD